MSGISGAAANKLSVDSINLVGKQIFDEFDGDESVKEELERMAEEPGNTFGNDPEKVYKFIPFVIKHIEKQHMKTPEIYLREGQSGLIEELVNVFDPDPDMEGEYEGITESDLEDISESDPHVVCGFLLKYFKSLPEPLLTYDVSGELLIIEKKKKDLSLERKIDMIKGTCGSMSKVQKNLSIIMLNHFNRVLANRKDNNVTEEKLAKAVTKIFLSVEDFSEDKYLESIFVDILKNYKKIFG